MLRLDSFTKRNLRAAAREAAHAYADGDNHRGDRIIRATVPQGDVTYGYLEREVFFTDALIEAFHEERG